MTKRMKNENIKNEPPKPKKEKEKKTPTKKKTIQGSNAGRKHDHPFAKNDRDNSEQRSTTCKKIRKRDKN